MLSTPTNADRAEWALQCAELFMQLTGCDPEDAMGDLIANLMHLCHQNEGEFGDFETALRRGKMHFEAELEEEEESEDN